jgi:hypothetical protein
MPSTPRCATSWDERPVVSDWQLHWLEAAGSLSPWREVLTAEINAGCEAADRRAALPAVDIIVQNVPGSGIPELGIGANAYRPSCFSLSLDPHNPRFAHSLAEGAVQRLVVHELHHCLRFAAIGWNHTLGDALVSEGLAGHFVRECLETPPELWETALGSEVLAEWSGRARKEAEALHYDHNAWFHGGTSPYSHDRTAPPRWAGYAIGFQLVGRYLNLHPQARPSQLCGIHAARLLKDVWP